MGAEQGILTVLDSRPEQKDRGLLLYFDFSEVMACHLLAPRRLHVPGARAPTPVGHPSMAKQVEELILLNLIGLVDTEAPPSPPQLPAQPPAQLPQH